MRLSWRRVLFGVNASASNAEDDGAPVRERGDRAGTIVVPIVVAAVAFGGSAFGSFFTSSDNDRTIAAERERVVEQFRRDQRQEHYAAIRQQATRLENAGSFSTAAVGSAFGAASIWDGLGGIKPAVPPNAARVPLPTPGLTSAEGGESYEDAYRRTYLSGVRDSWQEAYTGLDQAISNAEIASSDEVINLARALRDRYRNDYYQSIFDSLDFLLAFSEEPKPDRGKLADSLVGVPDDTANATYPAEYLAKSTDELTLMYVEAAKADLQLNDR